MLRRLLMVGAAGAALMYFLDPEHGESRRARVSARVSDLLRQGQDQLSRAGVSMPASDARRPNLVAAPEEPVTGLPDDAMLAQKVQTEVFRDASVPKGRININAEYGTIVVRGQVETQRQIDAIVAAVRRVPGVRDVVNLMHLPGTPAPNR